MRDGWIERNFMEFWFLRRKWFVRFLVIKIYEWDLWWMDGVKFYGILISRFEKEVICSIFGHKDSWINFMEFWFLKRKWFVRFLIIKIRGWNVWWMDRVKFHGILIFALQKKWFVWFLCLWRSSDLKVIWFLFDFCLWRFAKGTLIFDTMLLKDNIKRGIKYFQLMRVIWFIYKWWEILFYFLLLMIWTFFINSWKIHDWWF